ncbi:hypothetical protein B1R94_26095 [Mycolicibacterium litorale]|nr:hypothetical protein B1R94_26095 [Mycolicibacterium litorale]
MTSLVALDACHYYTTKTADGRFVGRVREFPELRSAPQKSALDARAVIVTATGKKLAELAAAIDPHANRLQPRTGDAT